jgi:hypothetical protein
MRSVPKLQNPALQLPLFHPRPCGNQPDWQTLPTEVREPVVPLLAQMMREHLARRHGQRAAQESGDE